MAHKDFNEPTLMREQKWGTEGGGGGGSEVEDAEILKRPVMNVIFPLCRNVSCEQGNLVDHSLIGTHVSFFYNCFFECFI